MTDQMIYVNQPLELTLDCECDISDATAQVIRYTDPDGTTDEWAATLFGTDNVQATVTHPVAGWWMAWAYVTTPDGNFTGKPFYYEIQDALPVPAP